MTRLLLFILVATGCARERAAAPPALDDLTHALFRDWEDDEAMAQHALDLADWLGDEGDTDESWDGMRLTNLAKADVGDVSRPQGTDLDAHAGIATAGPSDFRVPRHAELLVERDQTWTDPNTFQVYERTVVEGNPDAFAGGTGIVRTDNVIEKSGAFGIVIPYTLRKDYRWIPGPVPVVVGRTWITEPGCSDNGKNCVNQSWGLDVFVGDDDRTLRLYVVWLEVVTEADGLIGEDAKIALMAKGNQDILEATDEELASR
ncbi:MAG: hypothetical protein ACI8PZ_001037 [Myxococcota bacterium]|jgi:hypothetical protein